MSALSLDLTSNHSTTRRTRLTGLCSVWSVRSVNFNAFPFVFRQLHGFSLQQSGLSFLGIGIGMVIGTASQPVWNKSVPAVLLRDLVSAEATLSLWFPLFSSRRLYLRSKHAHGGVAPPEARLYSGMAGSILCPLGIFLFSATSMARIHWGQSVTLLLALHPFCRADTDSITRHPAAIPMVMSIPFGIGITWCFQSVFTFLVESVPLTHLLALYPPALRALSLISLYHLLLCTISSAYRPVAASAMASNSFMRSSFAAGFPLVRPLTAASPISSIPS